MGLLRDTDQRLHARKITSISVVINRNPRLAVHSEPGIPVACLRRQTSPFPKKSVVQPDLFPKKSVTKTHLFPKKSVEKTCLFPKKNVILQNNQLYIP